jgi:hypothetical protein
MSGAPIWSGIRKFAEDADQQRHDREEDHERRVHGDERVVELGQDDAAGRGGIREDPADERKRLAREAQLPPHHPRQNPAEEQERQARQQELLGDHLVIGREDVRPDEAELVVVLGLGSVVPGRRRCRRHLDPLQGAGGAAGGAAGCAVWSWLLTQVW